MKPKISLLTTIVLIVNLTGYSQERTLNFKVLDESTKEPVPYAVIVVYSQGEIRGGYCTEQGNFYLTLKSLPDSVAIRSVGYIPAILKQFTTQNKNIANLKSSTTELNPVIVKPGRLKSAGWMNTSIFPERWFIGQYIEEATLVPNKNQTAGKIDKVHFIAQTSGNCKCAIKVQLYSITENQTPGRALIPINTVVTIGDSDQNKKIELDISNFNIPFPTEGVFIGIEWIGTPGYISGTDESCRVILGCNTIKDAKYSSISRRIIPLPKKIIFFPQKRSLAKETNGIGDDGNQNIKRMFRQELG
jgi:hypothetical protein